METANEGKSFIIRRERFSRRKKTTHISRSSKVVGLGNRLRSEWVIALERLQLASKLQLLSTVKILQTAKLIRQKYWQVADQLEREGPEYIFKVDSGVKEEVKVVVIP